MKRHFDVGVVVPLDEEFETALSHFTFVSNLSTTQRVRFEVNAPSSDLSILLVKQNLMGKTECLNATLDIVEEFDVGMLVCLGIAGGLSADVSIGDICRSGEIVDLLDNAKVTDTTKPRKATKPSRSNTRSKSGGHEVSFSPTHYETPLEVSVALDLDKFIPERKATFEEWAHGRMEFGRSHIKGEFRGKDGRKEWIDVPSVRTGLIACAAVSGSSDYNKNIKKLDRKVLAIETESGGLFSVAKRCSIPALTVRGISDYAGFGIDKNLFERETNNKARLVAVSNASSYLARQMSNPRLQEFLQARSVQEAPIPRVSISSPIERLADTVISQAAKFNSRLKELSPAFALQNEGYRIPVPRIRFTDKKLNPVLGPDDEAVEFRDAVKQGRVIILEVPPQYPDRSIAWIAARDLLKSSNAEKQVVASVVDARDLHRPSQGLASAAGADVVALQGSDNAQIVFIVNEFDFKSKTQTQFLLSEVERFPNAKMIVVTRNRSNIISESTFARKTGALMARLDDISFYEISHFLQKNFEMPGPEAEVIAVRLHETFSKFKLSAHPSYFAGIPVALLGDILRANRRAELIELAVAGYLSFVVAEDNEPISLSRTTREKFLTRLVFETKFKKRVIRENDLIEMISDFAEQHDFKISAVKFLNSFLEKGILFVEDGKISFTLPFMETYLLAKKLHQEPEKASQYFQLGVDTFDIPTFAIYAELGLPDDFVNTLIKRLGQSIAQLREIANKPAALLTNTIQPVLFAKQDRVKSMQTRLQKAIADVASDNDQSHEKQRLIDAADRIRRAASQQTIEIDKEEARRTVEYNAVEIWFITVSLLGAGAERLDGQTKRDLVRKIIELTALILNDWTNEVAEADFEKIKRDLMDDDDLIAGLAKTRNETDLTEAKKTLESLVDILEYSLVSQPFRSLVQALCEEARDLVLAHSIQNTNVHGSLEKLLKSVWLADLDAAAGVKDLKNTIRELPSATFLRVTLASHLISRVYWRHWKREDRLMLLDAAQESMKISDLKYDTAGLQRLLDREDKK